MASLEKAAEIILTKCMAVTKGEKVLIVTDANKRDIAQEIYELSARLTKTDLIEIPVGKINGEEPPSQIAEKMRGYDVIFIITEKSLSHTDARKYASEAGARIASMPGVTKEILQRAVDVSYYSMNSLGQRIKEAMQNASVVNVLTSKGTMVTFSMRGRKLCEDKAMFTKPGEWGNIPSGEIFLAPIEGTANGAIVIDGSIAGIGKLRNSVTLAVRNGEVVRVQGADEAEKLKIMLTRCGKEALKIAEFGIGTNSGAKVSGVVLEDEKATGTCHFALGSNFSFGGTIKAKCHIDGIILDPTIIVDNKRIMERGKFLL